MWNRNRLQFLTGNGGTGFICRPLLIPNDVAILTAVAGVLSWLTYAENWIAFGTESPEETAMQCQEMFGEYLKGNCMIGTIQAYITTQPPSHILPCDGSSYLRADYPQLYEALDPMYRISATEFVVPDLRGKFLFGEGAGEALGDEAGAREHALTIDELPTHGHTSDPHDHSTLPHAHTYFQPTFGIDIESVGIPDPTGVGNPPLVMTTSPETVVVNPSTVTIHDTGSGEAHPNMPPFYAIKWGVVAR